MRMLLLAILAMAMLPVAVAAPVDPAPPLPAGVTAGPSLEGVSEYRLDNGLRVLLVPDASASTVQVQVVYLAGSRSERDGATGAAHLLEHMMFKGTPSHPDITAGMAAHGVSFSASTSYDRTVYSTSFDADPDRLAWVLGMEADRMVHSSLRAEDLASEMTVVRNEFEGNENNELRVLKQRLRSAAYDWHPYGNALIGARSDLENVPIGRLREFYRRWYRPDNAVLLVSGGIDAAATLASVRATFGAIARPSQALERTYTVEPTQDGSREITMRRSGIGAIVMAGYHIPAGAHPDYAAVALLSAMLTDVPNGRVHRALAAAGVSADVLEGAINPPLHDPFLLWMMVPVHDAADLPKASRILLDTIESAGDAPPATDELERQRDRMLKSFEMASRSPFAVARSLVDWIAAGDWRLWYLFRERLREVTPADVQRVAARYLVPSNRTVARAIPDPAPVRADVPPVPDLEAQLRDLRGDPGFAPGEPFEATRANIAAHLVQAEAGGVRMVMLPRKTRARTVAGYIELHFGDADSLRGKGLVAGFAGDLLMRGTRERPLPQLRAETDRLRSSLSADGDAGSATVRFETTRDRLPELIALAAEVLREPAYPDDAFERLKQQRLAELRRMRGDPLPWSYQVMQRHLQPYPAGDPRHLGSIDEQIAALQALTVEDVRAFHRQAYGAGHAEVALVGDFEPSSATDTVRDALGDWSSALPYAELACEFRDAPPMDKVLETPDKANAILRFAMNLDLSQSDPDWPALVLAGDMLGNGMDSRLWKRLREQEGLSYEVSADFTAPLRGRCGRFAGSAIVAPENMARLERGVREEIARALRDGFTEAELEAAKRAWLQRDRRVATAGTGVAAHLAAHLHRGEPLLEDDAFARRIESVDLATVNAALRRHLDPARLSFLKAGDFGGDAATESGR